MKDKKTIQYFDEYTPEYGTNRLRRAVEIIKRHGTKDSSLINIGCGTASDLAFIKRQTGLYDVCGMDVSQRSLEKAASRLGCETIEGNVLEEGIAGRIQKRYDFALLFSLLHHLIGKNRADSRRKAILAMANAMKLVKDGGYIIIEEPTFSTRAAMTALFYIKKIVSSIAPTRIAIGRKGNIGAPVTSFYANEQLVDMVKSVEGAEIIDIDIIERKTNPLWRLALILKKGNITITIKKRPVQ